jgi:hypothetical protein
MTLNIFCERQSGDLCRMHCINNYNGISLLNEQTFFSHCDKYDKLIDGLNSRSMDGFSEGRSIVSFVMDKLFNKFLLLIPIHSYNGCRNHLEIEHYNELIKKCNCFFEFNKNHIWVNKKINNKFYKIDSLSGVNETNVKCLNNNGYFLVIDGYNLYEEINYLINLIKKNTDNLEIYFYNLYYCLKKIDLSTNETIDDSKFLEKLITLKNIKKVLYDYIILKRKNKDISLQKKIVINIIDTFLIF